MTESGSTQLPPGARAFVEAAQSRAEQQRQQQPRAEITRAPEDLRDVRQPTRVRGEVVRHNDDGSVRVRTERGDIDVRPPRDQPAPREGQRVALQIQPGNPPREATIEQTQTQAQTQNTHTQSAQTVSSTEAQVIENGGEQRPLSTPVDLALSQSPQAATITPTAADASINGPTLTTIIGSPESVRLQPLSPQDVARVMNVTTPQIITTALPAPAPASIIIPAVTSALSQNITAQILPVQAPPLSSSQLLTPAPAPLLTSIVNTPSNAPAAVIDLAPPTPPRTINLFALTGLSVFNTGPRASLPPNITLTPPTINALPQAALAFDTPLAPLNSEISIDVRIQSVEPPRATLSAPSDPQTPRANRAAENILAPTITDNINAGNLRAVVTGLSAQNIPIVSFALPEGTLSAQSFALHIPAPDIPAGTQIQISPQSAPGALPQSFAVIAPPLPAFITPGAWPLLQDIQQAAAQLSAASAQVISNMTPSPSSPAQFTSAALFFLSAVRGGDIGGWLGDKTIDILRRGGRGDLLARLGQENGLMGRISAEPLSQDWRALALPMMWDNEMQKIMLFYRREDEDEGAEQSGEKQTRFIFDLNLSKMGPVQVDGLFRNKRLDVILRTEQRFTEHMHMTMRQTYADALRQTEITGELSFQNSPEQWVKINAEDQSQENHLA